VFRPVLVSEGKQAIQIVFEVCQVGDDRVVARILAADHDLVDEACGPGLGLVHRVAPDQGQSEIGVEITGDGIGPVEGDMGVHRRPLVLREGEVGDGADPRREPPSGVLGDDTQLDGGAAQVDIGLAVADLVAETEADLLAQQIRLPAVDVADAGRDVVFDLDPGVDLEQVGLAAAGDDPLPGADVVVVDVGGEFQRVLDDLV